jgi:hypothetical protein
MDWGEEHGDTLIPYSTDVPHSGCFMYKHCTNIVQMAARLSASKPTYKNHISSIGRAALSYNSPMFITIPYIWLLIFSETDPLRLLCYQAVV